MATKYSCRNPLQPVHALFSDIPTSENVMQRVKESNEETGRRLHPLVYTQSLTTLGLS
jgi:hypothetical protein